MNKALVLSGAVTFAFFAFYGLPVGIDGALSERVSADGAPSARAGVRGITGIAASRPPRSESTYQGKTARWWARRAVQARKDANARGRTIRRLRREFASREIGPTLAIRFVFGDYASQALRVAWCEGRWDPGATNGQYLGMFQMGQYARSTYGHASDALGQARAAYRYFAASGFDWSPWQCKP